MQTIDYKKQKGYDEPKMPNPNHQEQADPNLTELKGFTDPNEKLEPLDEAKENEDTEKRER
jgi:hypothetical protein